MWVATVIYKWNSSLSHGTEMKGKSQSSSIFAFIFRSSIVFYYEISKTEKSSDSSRPKHVACMCVSALKHFDPVAMSLLE